MKSILTLYYNTKKERREEGRRKERKKKRKKGKRKKEKENPLCIVDTFIKVLTSILAYNTN